MAATEPTPIAGSRPGRPSHRFILSILASTIGLLLLFQNCSVDLTSSTPGARNFSSSSCPLTTDESVQFEAILNASLQARTNFGSSGVPRCGLCHTVCTDNCADARAGSGTSGYVVFPGDSKANPGLVQKNACNLLGYGPSARRQLMNAQHSVNLGGRAFVDSSGNAINPAGDPDVQALANWLSQYASQ